MRPPRNAACPCGSGKKFKKCCGGPGAESVRAKSAFDPTASYWKAHAAAEKDRVPGPVADVVSAIALTEDFLDAVADDPDFEPFFEAATKFGQIAERGVPDEERLERFLQVHAAFDLRAGPGNRPPAAALLDRYRAELPDDAVRALEALLEAEDALALSSTQKGVAYLTRLADDRTLPCPDLAPGPPALILGRLVELDGRFCVLASQETIPLDSPSMTRKFEKDLVAPLAGVRRILARHGLTFRSDRTLMHFASMLGDQSPLPRLDAAPDGPPRSPQLVNADGHENLTTASYYAVLDLDLLSKELPKLRWKIEITPKRGPHGLRRIEADVLRKPRSKAFPPGEVVVAHLSANRTSLRVDTNSVERDLEVRRHLARVAPGAIRYTRTKSTSFEAVRVKTLSPEQLAREEQDRQKLLRDPEVQEALVKMRRDHARWWCDTAIPALANRKPRTLAKTAAGKARIAGLLEQIEAAGPGPEPDVFDPDLIRAELGLPPRFAPS